MKVFADRERCAASGLCSLVAEDVFDQDEDGTVVVLDDRPHDDRLTDVREAAAGCPALAITVEG